MLSMVRLARIYKDPGQTVELYEVLGVFEGYMVDSCN